MSQIQQLKEQLHHLAAQSNQAVGNLGQFTTKFAQSSQEVQHLIGGTATSTDQELFQLFEAAGKAVSDAIDALQQSAAACTTYANGL